MKRTILSLTICAMLFSSGCTTEKHSQNETAQRTVASNSGNNNPILDAKSQVELQIASLNPNDPNYTITLEALQEAVSALDTLLANMASGQLNLIINSSIVFTINGQNINGQPSPNQALVLTADILKWVAGLLKLVGGGATDVQLAVESLKATAQLLLNISAKI